MFKVFIQKKMFDRDEGSSMTIVMMAGLSVIVVYVRRHILVVIIIHDQLPLQSMMWSAVAERIEW